MLNLFKRNLKSEPKTSFFSRLKVGLTKTSSKMGSGLADLFLGQKTINQDLFDELEAHLLTADVGVAATTEIVARLTDKVSRKQCRDSEALYQALQAELINLLIPVEQPLEINPALNPMVILVIGMNGAGKTTTIGKLAKLYQRDHHKVMLAAGDTFRAAAVEQLQVWGDRNDIAVIAEARGADSASVIYDGMEAAKAHGVDILLADTAGRLHTQTHLMDELKKIKRVIEKFDASAPHEVLLVLDASVGQNALQQAKQFTQDIGVTGIALTKLDGTARGGILFSIAKELNLPIRYIAVGEGIDDLRPFCAQTFVEALF